MVAERKPAPTSPLRNGLEPAPLERWVCNGWDRRRGRVCTTVLMALERNKPHGRIEIICHKCGTMHTREAS